MRVATALLLLLSAFASLAAAQSRCGLSGPYTCVGGAIQGLEFGDDEDDDFFRYYLTKGDTSTSNSCTLFQEGEYSTSRSSSTVSVEFEIDDDECVITGDAPGMCNCVEEMSFVASNGCDTMTLSTGEVCTSSEGCSDSFTCPSGQEPIMNPNYTPDANGCGPSAFPLAGPSFGFLECCQQHDFCYGTCGTSRAQCDNNFFTCMYCVCQDDEYNFFERAACEELACTYFQAVDEFGCLSFNGGQEDSCICEANKAAEVKELNAMASAPSKFGPHGTARQTDLFCDAPFEPTCVASAQKPLQDGTLSSSADPIASFGSSSPSERSDSSGSSSLVVSVALAILLVL